MNKIELLLACVAEGYDRKAWHGPNLRGALRGIDATLASRRPGRGRHNIWEVAVHCAYWKFVVTRRITGDRAARFPIAGSNWFVRSGGETAWRADLKLLHATHRALLAAVRSVEGSKIVRKPAGSRRDLRRTIFGAAAHDVYHAGQIQLLKRLLQR